MPQRLVKTIQATQVRSIGQSTYDEPLSASETARLADVARRFDATIQLRRAGFTPREVRNLEFLRWSHEQNPEGTSTRV